MNDMPEPTDRAQLLAVVMNMIDHVETLLAVTNAIAGGIVTDPEMVRENAAANAEILEATLLGHRQFLDNSECAPGVKSRDVFNLLYDES